MKPIMVVGTGSHVGKTTIVTGLCRLFANQGLKVAPFKSQNMSLNSYATRTGKEIARATAVQAFAARQEPTVHMNPLLLKPCSDTAAQLIIHGRASDSLSGNDYFFSKQLDATKLEAINQSIRELRSSYDLIIAEGAGSCAEPNFIDRDFVNFKIAELLDADLFLVTDIDKGGIFAEILGTFQILQRLAPQSVQRFKGIIINKFRGDRQILQPALEFLKSECPVPITGILPYLHSLSLEEEDRVKERKTKNPEIDIAVLYLPHIANTTDFQPLQLEAGVKVRFVRSPEALGMPDLLILPGTKNTPWDLQYLRKTGWETAIRSLIPAAPIMGICGGFQMMGQRLFDPHGAQSAIPCIDGLKLIDFDVQFEKKKRVAQVEYEPTPDSPFFDAGRVTGYEIHCGKFFFNQRGSALFMNEEKREGTFTVHPTLYGTMVHDLFKNPLFTRSFINLLRHKKGLEPLSEPLTDPDREAHEQCDALASLIAQNCPYFKGDNF